MNLFHFVFTFGGKWNCYYNIYFEYLWLTFMKRKTLFSWDKGYTNKTGDRGREPHPGLGKCKYMGA